MTKVLKKDTHGHVQCYNAGCRCEECKQANAERHYKERKKREAKTLDPLDSRHGTYSFYTNFGCRCESCTVAHSEYNEPYHEAWRRRQGIGPIAPRAIPAGIDPNDRRHGTVNFYSYHKCRCRPCTDAKSASNAKSKKA